MFLKQVWARPFIASIFYFYLRYSVISIKTYKTTSLSAVLCNKWSVLGESKGVMVVWLTAMWSVLGESKGVMVVWLTAMWSVLGEIRV